MKRSSFLVGLVELLLIAVLDSWIGVFFVCLYLKHFFRFALNQTWILTLTGSILILDRKVL